jgi:hypothetical protein
MMFGKTALPHILPLAGLCACLFLSACHTDRLKVDVSDIQVEPVKIQRFDRDLFALNAGNIQAKLPEIQNKYPDFADLYIRNLLCPRGMNDSACIPEIIHFVADKDMHGAFDECQKVFPDMSAEEAALTDVFRHYKYYSP